jgi:glycosyltransferase involved in cell wall biosynthesis
MGKNIGLKNSKTDNKVLFVATSKNAKGGINTVIRTYSSTELWNKWHCFWIQTHIDKGIILKIWFFLTSLVQFTLKIPFYQLVHIHISEPPSAFRKFFFLEIASIFNKKIITHFHSYSKETTIEGKSQKLYHLIFKKSDKILVLSNYWQDLIILKWPEMIKKVEVIYNPCPSVRLNSNHQKTKTILFAGTLSARKGYADLIKGFSKIAHKNRDWKIIFAGNGEIEKAKQIVKDLKISDQIEFKGWVEGNIKESLFSEASIFCLPSYAEGFPMAVLDAWAYGLPVITTLVGGLSDVVIDGKNALVVNPGDHKDISEALDSLINDANMRTKLSKESVYLSRNPFSLNRITKQLDLIYSKLIGI